MFGVARSGNSKTYYAKAWLSQNIRPAAVDLRTRSMHNVSITIPATTIGSVLDSVVVRVVLSVLPNGAANRFIDYRLGVHENGAWVKSISLPFPCVEIEVISVGAAVEEEFVHIVWTDGPYDLFTDSSQPPPSPPNFAVPP